jgi:hypothetical protein
MLILVVMLLIGLFAGVWGFLMCFFPARWDKLTEAISFAGRWTEPSPKRLHPLIRFGNRVSGLVILAVGCWFAYMAASEIYLVLNRRCVQKLWARGLVRRSGRRIRGGIGGQRAIETAQNPLGFLSPKPYNRAVHRSRRF